MGSTHVVLKHTSNILYMISKPTKKTFESKGQEQVKGDDFCPCGKVDTMSDRATRTKQEMSWKYS